MRSKFDTSVTAPGSAAANIPRGTITGTVFADTDRDGVLDGGEAGVRGRTVFVDLDRNGIFSEGDLSARTHADGSYRIRAVPVGTWDVMVEDRRGSSDTSYFDDGTHYSWQETRYHWIEIGKPGNAMVLTNLDDGQAFLELSTPFTFYGQAYNELYISSNGYVTFGTEGLTSFANGQLPNINLPNAMIAPAWDDFDLRATGGVYSLYDAERGRLIIEWKNVGHFGDTSGETSTFQMILNDDGTIKYQYKAMASIVTATVGVEDAAGTEATQVLYNGTPGDGAAVLLTPFEGEYGVASVTVSKGAITGSVDFGQAPTFDPLAATAFGDDRVLAMHAMGHLMHQSAPLTDGIMIA